MFYSTKTSAPYVSVVIRKSETGEITKWYEDVKSKWKIQIKGFRMFLY